MSDERRIRESGAAVATGASLIREAFCIKPLHKNQGVITKERFLCELDLLAGTSRSSGPTFSQLLWGIHFCEYSDQLCAGVI